MLSPLWRWRSWVLVLLLVGPVLAYVGLGIARLCAADTGGLHVVAAVLWLLPFREECSSILAARWTKTSRPLLPPLDWDSSCNFSPLDREALEARAGRGFEEAKASLADALLGSDTYINTGRSLFRRIAGHYHPFTNEPLDDVPLVELMTGDRAGRGGPFPGMCAGRFPGATWSRSPTGGEPSRSPDTSTGRTISYSLVLPFLNPVAGASPGWVRGSGS